MSLCQGGRRFKMLEVFCEIVQDFIVFRLKNSEVFRIVKAFYK